MLRTSYTRWILAGMLLVLPLFTLGQGINAGFVQGIWYSHEPVFADETVRIYVALRNNTEDDLTGTVTFTDNGEVFGTRNVSAISGRLVEAWADWDATFGEHRIEATLGNIQIDGVGSNNAYASVTSALAEDVIIVDYDTDGDGIGNAEDTDDDGDGVSDEVEKANGTDPLVYDEPEDESGDTDTEADNESDQEETPDEEDRATDAPESEGLERFFSDGGRVHDTLESVTNTVNTSKAALDRYRTARNEAIADQEAAPTPTEEATSTETDESAFQPLRAPGATETATITRTQIDSGPGVFDVIIDVTARVFGTLYTFVLFALSLFLGYPAVVEVALLLLILYLVYRFAKKLGSRPSS